MSREPWHEGNAESSDARASSQDQQPASVATGPPEPYLLREPEVIRAIARSLGFPSDSMNATTKLNGITAGWIARFAIAIWDDSRDAAIRAIADAALGAIAVDDGDRPSEQDVAETPAPKDSKEERS